MPTLSDNTGGVHSAVILAGGLGTRLRDAVPDLPKAMAPIHGRPFLEHQMDYWIRQGIGRFVLSVGYRREVIMEHFGNQYRGALIEYAVEEVPLGTGGGLLLAAAKLNHKEPFLLLNGDSYFEVALTDLVRFHLESRSDWTFSLFRADDIQRYMGMELDTCGRILSLQSDTPQPGQLANGGVYLVHANLVSGRGWKPGTKLSLEKEMLPVLLEDGARLFGLPCPGRFIDIGLPEDYLRSPEILKAGREWER